MSSLVRRALIELVRFLIFCVIFDYLLDLLSRVFGDVDRKRKLRPDAIYPRRVPALQISSCTPNEMDICIGNGAK